MKQIIKLTESDLHRIVKESVNKVLKEDFEPYNVGDDAKVLMFIVGGKVAGSILVPEDFARYFDRVAKIYSNSGLYVQEREATQEDYYKYADRRSAFLDTPMR